MRLKNYFILTFFIICSSDCYSQAEDSTMSGLSPDSGGSPLSNTNITLTSYFQLLKGNFIQQAFVPFQMSNRERLQFAGFAVGVAGVMTLDKPINRVALRLHEKSGAVKTVSPLVTKFGGRYALFTMIGIGSWSYVFKNQKLTNTTLLATQSYITSGIWVSVLKFVSGRERPSFYDPQSGQNRGLWHGMFFQFKKDASGNKPNGGQYSSFPSGHAAAAFSIATVYAEMYKDKPWVPVLSYTSASLIGLSRVTESRHWASDVLVSAALGYLCGKQVVRNFHRLERLSSITRRKKNVLSYNINFINGTVMPELVYRFR